MVEYILDDTPKTPFVIKHIGTVSIILATLVGVVAGVCFWSSIDYDKKVVFIMALLIMPQRIKYILEDTPRTPIVERCFAALSIVVPILIGVVVGVHCCSRIDADKKFSFVMGMVVGTLFLIERFLAAVRNYLDV